MQTEHTLTALLVLVMTVFPGVKAVCPDEPCLNGGTCVSNHLGASCVCPRGISGVRCQNDPCSSNPCNNGGSCIRSDSGYNCYCRAGFSGVFCEIGTGTCSPNPCLYGGTCVSTLNGFRCQCPPTYAGDRCEIASDRFCNPNPCVNGGTCVSTLNGFRCQCPNTFGGGRCQIASVQNFCASNPCVNGGTCIRTIASFRCYCGPSFTGDFCQVAAGCRNNLDQCEYWASLGECNTVFGRPYMSVQCRQACGLCNQVITGGNSCLSRPCLNGGSCITTNTGYICSCPRTSSGPRCERIVNDACVPNPCNSGACRLDENREAICDCLPGIVGSRCEQDLCSPNPCNGGVCRRVQVGYYCECPDGNVGRSCEAGCEATYVALPGRSANVILSGTVATCQERCSGEPMCQGFDYQRATSTCYLTFNRVTFRSNPVIDHYQRRRCESQDRSQLVTETPPTPSTTAQNAIIPACQPEYRQTNNSRIILEVGTIMNSDNVEKCNAACTSQPDCRAFDFYRDSDVCILVSREFKLEPIEGVGNYEKVPCSPQ